MATLKYWDGSAWQGVDASGSSAKDSGAPEVVALTAEIESLKTRLASLEAAVTELKAKGA